MQAIDVLVAAGRALYGDRWHTSVARDLGTTYRTIRNWLDGRHPTPIDLEDRLRRLLAERRLELDAVLGRIDIREDESRKQ
ncbi:hypothetical protein [Sphingomonas corticis]|jgi:hypothetical protein|uniref:XRE family transcriptional regulator n=1 Tax=Sphingomonas corticis TaxID=2722791 RepID=A0ABX1CHN1_9SPHN|nr:hypothetical protein [Sphingomonas corticis]NJR77511.1 hypothetical protein [Sphingomonas corticis]